jgi:hypothetical protein
VPRTLRRTSPWPSTPRVATVNDPTQPITETSPTPRIILQSAALFSLVGIITASFGEAFCGKAFLSCANRYRQTSPASSSQAQPHRYPVAAFDLSSQAACFPLDVQGCVAKPGVLYGRDATHPPRRYGRHPTTSPIAEPSICGFL